MITRSELLKNAKERLKDAEALLAAHRYDGAVYLAGYVVEFALKGRICKCLKWDGFPQTSGEFEGLQSFKTHKPDMLLSLSGAEPKIKSRFVKEWSVVVTWNPEARYKPAGSTSKAEAETTIRAAKALVSAL